MGFARQSWAGRALASLPLPALTLAGCDSWPEQVAGTCPGTAAGQLGRKTLLEGWVWTWHNAPLRVQVTGRLSGGLTCAHVLLGTHRARRVPSRVLNPCRCSFARGVPLRVSSWLSESQARAREGP